MRQHDRVSGRRDHARDQSNLFAVILQPASAGFEVRLVLRLRGDAWKTDVVAQFLHEAALIFFKVIENSLHGQVVAT